MKMIQKRLAVLRALEEKNILLCREGSCRWTRRDTTLPSVANAIMCSLFANGLVTKGVIDRRARRVILTESGKVALHHSVNYLGLLLESTYLLQAEEELKTVKPLS